MSIVIVVHDRDNEPLQRALQSRLPGVEISCWPQIASPEKIEFAVAWKAPPGTWRNWPNLRAIQCFGAGVDGLLADTTLPQLPMSRIVDPQLASDIAQYVLTMVLQFKLGLPTHAANQRSQCWQPTPASRHRRVGLLGMGQLGQACARLLALNGFEVSGWSRSQKQLDKVACFYGESGLVQLVQSVDYLVCLLPLTSETKGIVNRALFEKMPSHAVLINVGRGEHVVQADLLLALEQQQIAGAALDVFTQEPLPPEHPFWRHPSIVITPHCAALTNFETACEQIAANYRRVIAGELPHNLVDRERGY